MPRPITRLVQLALVICWTSSVCHARQDTSLQQVSDTSYTSSLLPRKANTRCEKWKGDNGLSLVLVEDPTLSDSAIGLLSKVGFLSMPIETPMAQIVEHSLSCCANKMFPAENSIYTFTTQREGKFLSWTGAGYTMILSSVKSDYLEDLMLRFTGAIKYSDFKDVLTNTSSILQRNKTYQDDIEKFKDWIALQNIGTNKESINRNLITEKGLSSTSPSDVYKWFINNYRPENLTFIVVTNNPLDSIRDKFLSIMYYAFEQPQSKPEESSKIQIATNKFIFVDSSVRSIKLAWTLSRDKCIAQRDEIALVLGLSSTNDTGLLQILIKKGLVTSIDCDIQQDGPDCNALFIVSFDITESGVKEWKTIVGSTLEAIHRMSKESDMDVIIAQEQIAQELMWMYPEQHSSMQKVFLWTSALICEPLESAPRLSSVPSILDYDPILTSDNLLKQPFSIILKAPFEEWLTCKDGVNKPETKDELYSKYSQPWSTPIFTTLIDKVSPIPIDDNFYVSTHNMFIPFHVLMPTIEYDKLSDDFNMIPISISSMDNHSINFITDKCFGAPKCIWHIEVSPPTDADTSALEITKERIWYTILKSRLSGLMSDASKAGAIFNIYNLGRTLHIQLSCWDTTENNILDRIISSILQTSITPQEMQKAKTEIQNNIMQCISLPTAQLASEEFIRVTAQPSMPNLMDDVKLMDYLGIITIDNINQMQSKVLSSYQTIVVHINKDDLQVEPIGHKIFSCFQGPTKLAVPLSSKEYNQIEFYKSKSSQPNNAIIVGIRTGASFSPETYAYSYILANGLNTIFSQWLAMPISIEFLSDVSVLESGGNIFIAFTIQTPAGTSYVLSKQVSDFLLFVIDHFSDAKMFNIDKFELLNIQLQQFIDKEPMSIEEMGEKLYKVATTRYNWTFWDRVLEMSSTLSYEDFKLFAFSVLNPYTNKSVCVFVEGTNKS